MSVVAEPAASRSRARSWVLPAYAATIFASAALLFVVEPMVSKTVLPLLGGTPAVCNTCLLFFQLALLLGYLYAHLAAGRFGVRRHAPWHLALLVAAGLTLPLAAGIRWTPPASANPAGWLLGVLAVSIGAPFVLLSSTGPLLQRWFTESDHPDAANPYFLYAASNAGSFVALLGYPLLIEPLLPLGRQRALWAAGYAVLVVSVGVCAMALRRERGTATVGATGRSPSPGVPEAPAVRERAWWVALAAVPSSMMMGVTTYLTTDLAAVPLLWVVPLSLYLLTFVIVFARRPPVPHRLALRWEALLIVVLAVMQLAPSLPATSWMLLLHLVTFFFVALACHGELARRRPDAAHLTEFYLWLAVGGVVGGVFNALVAPLVFRTLLEYPIVLAAACLVRPRQAEGGGRGAVGLELGVFVLLASGAVAALMRPGSGVPPWAFLLAGGALAVLALRLQRSRAAFAAAVVLLLAGREVVQRVGNPARLVERNFFGVRAVRDDPRARLRTLMHGTTRHGAQSLDPARRREVLTYYHPTGPLGDVFRALPADRPRRVGIVGLGTGGIAAYARPGERWTFFEIDPDIARLARDTSEFTFLADSRGAMSIVLGDGRLSLARVPDASLDLLVLDAFTSDAIPVHLLTREAVGLYLRKVAPDGMVAFHVSNRYLRLEPVLARLAEGPGVAARVRVGIPDERRAALGVTASQWVVLARSPATLARLGAGGGWLPARPEAGVGEWTDDYSNLFSVLRLR